MPDSGSTQSNNSWPLAKFAFSVKIGDAEALFQEITGLNAETGQIEYRSNNSPVFSTTKMPGIRASGNVTLKKGIFKDDKAFWKLYQEVKMQTFERETITISLLDEEQRVAMSWSLLNAYPLKMTGADKNAGANEATVETMELTHEGLQIIT